LHVGGKIKKKAMKKLRDKINAVPNADILIESTRGFEKDIAKWSEDEKAAVIQKINYGASLFPHQKLMSMVSCAVFAYRQILMLMNLHCTH
jgi:hypothetical protein